MSEKKVQKYRSGELPEGEVIFVKDILEAYPEIKGKWEYYMWGFLRGEDEVLLVKCNEEEGSGEFRLPRKHLEDPVWYPLTKNKLRDKLMEDYELMTEFTNFPAKMEIEVIKDEETLYPESERPKIEKEIQIDRYAPDNIREEPEDLLKNREGYISFDSGRGLGIIYIYDQESGNRHKGPVFPMRLRYRKDRIEQLDEFLDRWFEIDLRDYVEKKYTKESDKHIFVPEEKFYSMESDYLDSDTRALREIIQAHEKGEEPKREGDIPFNSARLKMIHE